MIWPAETDVRYIAYVFTPANEDPITVKTTTARAMLGELTRIYRKARVAVYNFDATQPNPIGPLLLHYDTALWEINP